MINREDVGIERVRTVHLKLGLIMFVDIIVLL